MKLKLIIIVLGVILLNSCNRYNYNVVKVGERTEVKSEEGIYYMLPRTVISVDFTIHKIDKLRGPYCNFAKKYLGLSTVIYETASTYQIADITITAQNEADPSQSYLIVFPKNGNKQNDILLQFSEDYIIQSINTEVDNKIDNESVMVVNANSMDNQTHTFKHFANNNLFEKVDTIIEMVNMDTMMVEKRTYKRSVIEKTLEQRAKDAADYIMKLREGKYNLMTGYQEINYSIETIDYMYNELDKLEKEYLTLFSGKEVVKELHYKYEITASKEDTSNVYSLFKFSEKYGVMDMDGYGGEIISIRIVDTEILSNIDADINAHSKAKKQGIFYRLPTKARVVILRKGISLAEREVNISQFGAVNSLPRNKFSVVFYNENGSIKKIEMNNKK
jgi:Domain of unknown function (DUF4831)